MQAADMLQNLALQVENLQQTLTTEQVQIPPFADGRVDNPVRLRLLRTSKEIKALKQYRSDKFAIRRGEGNYLIKNRINVYEEDVVNFFIEPFNNYPHRAEMKRDLLESFKGYGESWLLDFLRLDDRNRRIIQECFLEKCYKQIERRRAEIGGAGIIVLFLCAIVYGVIRRKKTSSAKSHKEKPSKKD
jgi:hypothetical protein